MEMTWLEHFRRYKHYPLWQLRHLLCLTQHAYRRLERGLRQPSAKITFALFVLFEGYSFGALMLKGHFSRGDNNTRVTPGQERLIQNYKPRQFAYLRYRDPLYEVSAHSIVAVDQPRRPSMDDTPEFRQELVHPGEIRYRTGRWTRPWVARMRQVPHIRPAKINRLMERLA